VRSYCDTISTPKHLPTSCRLPQAGQRWGGVPSFAPREKETDKTRQLKKDRTFSELVHCCPFAKYYDLTPTVMKNVTA
jgi:hypothetical protein